MAQKKSSKGTTEKNQNRQAAETDTAKRDSGRPGGGTGRRDVVEPIPENIRVDPYITEGNPGYQESGDSEIIPRERLASGATEPMQRGKSSPKKAG